MNNQELKPVNIKLKYFCIICDMYLFIYCSYYAAYFLYMFYINVEKLNFIFFAVMTVVSLCWLHLFNADRRKLKIAKSLNKVLKIFEKDIDKGK